MARKLRIEESGGLYHVINRGNYRQWVFREEGAKLAFEATLFEACERAGWKLHAFCIMGNHFHLALETPDGNLSEGMRWLQGVFATRFNRYRKQSGHLFQGRFKSLVVENSERLAWLCHYIHLNPVRARICRVEEMTNYRWASTWYLSRPKERPGCLSVVDCLNGAGSLADQRSGWDRYFAYLAWLSEDEPARKQMAFDRMSRGWVIGSDCFRRALAQDEQAMRPIARATQAEARLLREEKWQAALAVLLKRVRKTTTSIERERKAADWKVAIAADLKQRYMCTNPWLAANLHMGAPAAVCRYVAELRRGARPDAASLLNKISNSNI